MPETKPVNEFALLQDLLGRQRQAFNRILRIETAVGATVGAEVGNVKRRKQGNGFSEPLPGHEVCALCHFLETAFGRRGKQAYEVVEIRRRCPERRFHISRCAGFDFFLDCGPVRLLYFVVEAHFHPIELRSADDN